MADLMRLMTFLGMHTQGLPVSTMAQRTGLHRKAVRQCIKRGAAALQFGPRPLRPDVVAPVEPYVRERLPD